MRTFALTAAAAVLALSAGSAFAWSDVTGTIKSVDAKTHLVTLDNGKTYMAENTVNLSTFKIGDKVTVSTQVENGKDMVNKVTKNS